MKNYIYLTHYRPKVYRPKNGIEDLFDKLNLGPKDFKTAKEKITVRNLLQSFNPPSSVAKDTAILTEMLTYYANVHSYLTDDELKRQQTHTFQIPKKSGGYRTIIAPSNELKYVHKVLLKIMQDKLNILEHDAAYAYCSNRSTKDALRKHQENDSKYFLKVDIEDFFGSCSKELIKKQLFKVFPFTKMSPRGRTDLADIATLDNALPQGFPLSPYITNMLMVPFDYEFSAYCKRKKLTYTRYADDIIVSSKEEFPFEAIIQKMKALFVDLEYPFNIKESKTRFGTREGRNWNLGLMLNKDNNITVGHVKKKILKTILFQLSRDEITSSDHIRGLFSYLKQIEPSYYAQLDSYSKRCYNKNIKELIR